MKVISMVIGLAVFASAGTSAAGVPGEIAYQGFITQNNVPVEGTHDLQFAVFADSAGGSSLWQEGHQSVAITAGVFKVLLGTHQSFPADLFAEPNRYLETTVDGQVLAPRTGLAAVPYAFAAARSDTAAFAQAGGSGESVWQQNGQDISYTGGNVGIGTDSPDYHLQVLGDNHGAAVWVGSSTGSYGNNATYRLGVKVNPTTFQQYWALSQDPDASGSFDFGIEDFVGAGGFGRVLHIKHGTGNVGIGTNNPDHRLRVSGGSIKLDNNRAIVWQDAGGSSDVGAIMYDNQNRLIFRPGAVDQVTITPGGDVGIGTTSPANKLHVVGGIQGEVLANTPQPLGNGSCYANLGFNNLTFDGSYGYAVGDEYIQFNSNFHPQIGGQGPMVRITANRLPEHYDTGRGRLSISARNGAAMAEVLALEAGGVTVSGDITATGTIYGNFSGTINNALLWNGHAWGEPYDASGSSPNQVLAGFNSGQGHGVYGETYASLSGYAGVTGQARSSGGSGVRGFTRSLGVPGGSSVGVYGDAPGVGPSIGGAALGVLGKVDSYQGSSASVPVGVFGWATTTSGVNAGVWGESRSSSGFGVYGAATSTSGTAHGVVGRTDSPNGRGVYYSGGLAGSGPKSAVVKTSRGPTLVYCQESPENWFEDFGVGQLRNGKAHVTLDPLYQETVTIDQEHPMLVFVQLNDECAGVYVERGAGGFDVIELNGGTSNAEFSYRVVAKRRGFETNRLDEYAPALSDPFLYPENRTVLSPAENSR